MARQKQDGLHTDVGESHVDLRGKEDHFCTRRADGKIEITGAAGYADGVISEGRPAGKHTSFNTPGNPILRVKAGAALARGALVVSDATGRAVAGTTNVFGKVRNPVGAADEIVEIIPGRIADAVDDVV